MTSHDTFIEKALQQSRMEEGETRHKSHMNKKNCNKSKINKKHSSLSSMRKTSIDLPKSKSRKNIKYYFYVLVFYYFVICLRIRSFSLIPLPAVLSPSACLRGGTFVVSHINGSYTLQLSVLYEKVFRFSHTRRENFSFTIRAGMFRTNGSTSHCL
jgi:hypothetical protein